MLEYSIQNLNKLINQGPSQQRSSGTLCYHVRGPGLGMTEADDKWLQHGHDATSLCGTILALLPFLDSCTQMSANKDYSRRPFALLLLKKLSGEYEWSLAMGRR